MNGAGDDAVVACAGLRNMVLDLQIGKMSLWWCKTLVPASYTSNIRTQRRHGRAELLPGEGLNLVTMDLPRLERAFLQRTYLERTVNHHFSITQAISNQNYDLPSRNFGLAQYR
jgi:hypothetical protein